MSKPLTIGVDFDNTLVCYDKSVLALAKRNFSVSERFKSKSEVKSYITDFYGNFAWTKFQGELYGPGMEYAEPYENAVDTISELSSLGVKILILSHRSKHPYAGKKYDLHKYAKNWITKNLKFENQNTVKETSAFFFEDKAEKIQAIKDNACDFFLDDLIEIISSKDFPSETTGILFDPEKKNKWSHCISNWKQLKKIVGVLP